jgi:Zn finger protein HypA/HybF involved in hydrogenase expression
MRQMKEDGHMAAKSGEKAWETGDFRCEKCHAQFHVTQGETIPRCPNCGNDTFDTRYHEPGSKQS